MILKGGNTLKIHLSDKIIPYTGAELTPHWIYRNFDIKGDAIVSFQGPCDVSLSNMVDLEDVKKKAPIYSPLMLHFLGEWFIDSLEVGILLQHLLVFQVYELLLERGAEGFNRIGNDIFFKDRKLSVSIATKSRVSVLVHVGLNIETNGTPIPTSGLNEIGANPFHLAKTALERFRRDDLIWKNARVKVRPI